MSLTSALSFATSGLSATQSQISTVSNNIANADAAGYTKKTAATTSRVVSGQGAGVETAEVTSAVDKNLLRQRDSAASELAAADVTAAYLDSLQTALGSTDGDDGLTDAISDLSTALAALALTPESSGEAANVVSEAEDLAESINRLSDEIQSLRLQADQDIAAAVDSVNASLHRLDELNEQIAKNEALGLSTADLEDQRAAELESLSEKMNVTSFVDSDNQLYVYTSGGTPLLDSNVNELEFTGAGAVSSDLIYDPSASSGLSGITVGGEDITADITGGEIGALLELRDETLPAYQDAVNELAETLVDSMNAVHNKGTSLPSPGSLTGTATVNGSDALDATGSIRIAVVDSDGTVQEVADLDLSTYATYDDLVNAVDAIDGLSASINADGQVVIVADDPNMGVSINEMDSAVGSDGEGISNHLGLNDLYVVDESGQISVRSDIAENPDLLATGTLSDDAALATGDTGLNSGDASTATLLAEALSADQSFDSAGALGSMTGSVSDYAAALTSVIASDAASAEADSELAQLVYDNLSSSIAAQAGVNLDEETAELSVLETNYAAMAQVIATIQAMYDTLMDMV